MRRAVFVLGGILSVSILVLLVLSVVLFKIEGIKGVKAIIYQKGAKSRRYAVSSFEIEVAKGSTRYVELPATQKSPKLSYYTENMKVFNIMTPATSFPMMQREYESVSAISTTIALAFASKYFEEQCHLTLKESGCPPTHVFSEVDECLDNSNSEEDEIFESDQDGEAVKDEEGELITFSCYGSCLNTHIPEDNKPQRLVYIQELHDCEVYTAVKIVDIHSPDGKPSPAIEELVYRMCLPHLEGNCQMMSKVDVMTVAYEKYDLDKYTGIIDYFCTADYTLSEKKDIPGYSWRDHIDVIFIRGGNLPEGMTREEYEEM